MARKTILKAVSAYRAGVSSPKPQRVGDGHFPKSDRRSNFWWRRAPCPSPISVGSKNRVKNRTSFQDRLLWTGFHLLIARSWTAPRFRLPQSTDARIKQKMSAIGMADGPRRTGKDRLRHPPFVAMMKSTNLGNRNDAFRLVPLNLTRRRGVLI